jgi:hypothetical protein
MKARFGLCVVFATLMVGCATQQEVYSPANDSFALRVVKAANMNKDLKDTQLPKDTVSTLNNEVYKASSLVSGYNMPLPGVSQNAMLGLGLLSFLADDEPAARNSIIVWLPKEVVGTKNPKEVVYTLVKEAFDKVVVESGNIPGESYFHPKKGFAPDFALFELKNGTSSKPCASDTCSFTIGLGDFEVIKSQKQADYVGRYDILGNAKAEIGTVHFSPTPKVDYTNYRDFEGFSSQFNELAFLQAISSHLPEYFYFYVAPNRVAVGDDEKVKVPLIISRGKLNYFVKE